MASYAVCFIFRLIVAGHGRDDGDCRRTFRVYFTIRRRWCIFAYAPQRPPLSSAVAVFSLPSFFAQLAFFDDAASPPLRASPLRRHFAISFAPHIASDAAARHATLRHKICLLVVSSL